MIFGQGIVYKGTMVFDRQYVVEAWKESPNHVVGEEGHVNSCRIL